MLQGRIDMLEIKNDMLTEQIAGLTDQVIELNTPAETTWGSDVEGGVK